MYLKSIEIHGFKSFANKIVFQFKDGITGIVGPNGSGKSNVGDAVRWVLGEQSAKQLRGAKMEDVIFAGTEARKPLGYAYVAITLDNADHKLPIEYDEVTVARRVYRSGESEYLINGANCRLKDVQELFLDTGIGKEGYSIIGQGQIDKILSGKPEDRRELFDEAAGIVKYKKRQAIALKNLEEEKINLSRVNDIINEIEKQVIPLEKQSEVAKVYLKYKEELKLYEINQFLLENESITNQKDDIDSKLQIAIKEFEQSKIDFETTKEEYSKLEQKIETYNQQITENNTSLAESRIQKEKLEGEIKVFEEQVNSLSTNIQTKMQRMKAIGYDISQKRKEQERFVDEKKGIDVKLSSLNAVQKAKFEELEVLRQSMEELRSQIDQCNSEIFDRLNDNTGIKTDKQRYTTMLEQNNIKKVEINQKLIKNKSEEAEIVATIDSMKEQKEKILGKIQDKNTQGKNVIAEIHKIQEKINLIDHELSTKHQEYLVEKSKLTSLKNLAERYDGYGQSIKRVMEQKQNNHGIIGVVADIIKVEKQYEIAIEIALGGSIQNIVTDNEHTAKDMIAFLKRNKYGRATFLPLTNITFNRGNINEQVLKEPGILGFASDLVSADEKYRQVVNHLLGRIIVAQDIDVAIQTGKKYKNTLRIVTMEGDLINPGGAMSGGAFKNSSNLLGRKRETEELEKKVTELLAIVEEMAAKKEEMKAERISLQEQAEKLKDEVQTLLLEENTVQMNISAEQQKQEKGQLVFRELNYELKQIDSQMIDLKQNIDHLDEKLKLNETLSSENETKIDELNQKLSELRENETSKMEETSGLRLEFSTLEQSGAYVNENLKRLKKEIERLTEEEEGLSAGVEADQLSQEEKQDAIDEMVQKVTSYTVKIKELDDVLQAQIKEKDNLAMDHKSFLTKREKLSELMNSLDKEVFRLNGIKDRLLGQFEDLKRYMLEEYELTHELALQYKDKTLLDVGYLKKKANEIKNKIRDLGNVNVNAIEDYKSLTERHTFLRTQRDDLMEAEEKLLDVIADLDAEMRKQFEEKFDKIKVQFDLVFKELFGGGKGTLELMDDEDILEAGIRITAQPPGKKLQNMMQLSGGEKALTAIALLFAIQNLKPSPFCLLDEIEAALDDSNVNRFAGYLNKLTNHTQFIIITHRRGTMNAANTLYGITMQEKGVSTLVSVDLIKKDLEE